MPENTEEDRVRTTVVVSPAWTLNMDDLKSWAINFVIFVAPTLAIFFTLLAKGVYWETALPVALLALYQSLADLFTKLKGMKVRLAEGSELAQKEKEGR